MNILAVCHYGLYSDLTASFVHNQVKAYAALGHRVRVIIPIPFGKRLTPAGARGGPLMKRRTADGAELYYIRFLSLSNYGERHFNTPSALVSLFFHLPAILDGFSPDAVHAHTLGLDSQIGAWLKKRLNIPLAVTTHGSDASIPIQKGKHAELRSLCDQAGVIAAVSSALAEKVRSSGTMANLSVILNGFNLHALPERREGAGCSILQAGHLLEQKRYHITIRAFAKIRESNPGASLTLVGDGPERKRLEALCQELGVDGAVRFTGQIPNGEVLKEMSNSRFFVMPSVNEGFGIVYLEAMASGCITIGTEGEGIADLIVSGKNGFLVPPDDPEAIVEAIEWCLAHPWEAAAIAERGRQAALGLTWEKNAAQYISLFESLKERTCCQ